MCVCVHIYVYTQGSHSEREPVFTTHTSGRYRKSLEVGRCQQAAHPSRNNGNLYVNMNACHHYLFRTEKDITKKKPMESHPFKSWLGGGCIWVM